jgi:ABC-2 type transport system ATP-binding protein
LRECASISYQSCLGQILIAMLPGFDIEGALSEIEIALQGADLERATSRLLDLKDNIPLSVELSGSVINLNREYNELRKMGRNNTLTYEDSQRAAAGLTMRILDLCQDIRRTKPLVRVSPHPGRWIGNDEPSPASLRPAPSTNTPVTPLNELLSPLDAEDQERSAATSVVTLAQVVLQYRGFRLFVEDLKLDEGIMLGVVGANSSGKTSLLRILAGDLRPSTGRIQYPKLGNIPRDWYVVKQQIAYVKQLPEAWHGIAIDMLRFEAASCGHLGAANEHWVSRWVDRLRLGEHVNKTWDQLSGGFKTRFELAKALIRQPRLLVLDEPLAVLDPPAQITFLWDIQTFCKDHRLAIAISSQHLHEVEAFAHDVRFLQDGSISTFLPDGNGHMEIAFDVVSGETYALLKSIDPDYRFDGYAFHLRVRELSANDVLAKARNLPARITYFRDISKSTARLFR